MNTDLLFQQHDAPAGLDGADLSVFVHGDHQQAVHHPLLPLTGVHQQIRPAQGGHRGQRERGGTRGGVEGKVSPKWQGDDL